MRMQLIGRYLIESAHRPRRSFVSFAASGATHGVLIGLAVCATIHPAGATARARRERPVMVELSPPPKPVEQTGPTSDRRTRGFQILVSPRDIPVAIPPIDATRPAT